MQKNIAQIRVHKRRSMQFTKLREFDEGNLLCSSLTALRKKSQSVSLVIKAT